MAVHIRGQGATEYLVLLAVVLIIALVSIALLGFFPGMSSDAKITQSSSYWQSASPLAILSHSISANGNGTIVIRNNDASGTLTMTAISIGSTTTSGSYSFGSGETRNINVTAASGNSGQIYDFAVNITYTSAYGLPSKQYGQKTLIGKYI
ncbi:MAG: hypothetical protein NT051_05625 [Candidatus Micrarchaeota archaeon]|nr:hypothetical protein [Candidatus Micrarchaeota archaeon]